jgi:hypothetical protein
MYQCVIEDNVTVMRDNKSGRFHAETYNIARIAWTEDSETNGLQTKLNQKLIH